MDPSTFGLTGTFENCTTDMLGFFSRWMSIEGKKCLCIGFDKDQLNEAVLAYQPGAVTLLTLWDEHKDAEVPGYDTVVGDICQRTPFDDGTFDVVLTLSLLEHIHDLPAAFVEIRRILKPGGFFGSFFGPAWSCHVGHHLYAQASHPLFDFWQRGLPAHLHLRCSPEEITAWYREQGATDDEIKTVLQWFFETNIINRVFFDDYPRLLNQHFQVVSTERIYAPIAESALDDLRRLYPGNDDFSTYGGKFLVRKRAPAY